MNENLRGNLQEKASIKGAFKIYYRGGKGRTCDIC